MQHGKKENVADITRPENALIWLKMHRNTLAELKHSPRPRNHKLGEKEGRKGTREQGEGGKEARKGKDNKGGQDTSGQTFQIGTVRYAEGLWVCDACADMG